MQNKTGPLYLQLAEELKESIKKDFQQGEPFYSEAQIEQNFKVSRITVRHALNILEKEGYIFRKAGNATLVSRIKPIVDTGHRLGKLEEELRNMGLKVHSKYFDFGTTQPPFEALKKYGITFPHAKLYHFKHLLLADDKPISYAINYILEDPARIHLTEKDLEKMNFYDVLAVDYDINIIDGEQSIGALVADKTLAALFKVKEGSPLLKTEIAAAVKEGTKKLYVEVFYDAQLFQFRQLIQR